MLPIPKKISAIDTLLSLVSVGPGLGRKCERELETKLTIRPARIDVGANNFIFLKYLK
jgi:hypothetical protein